MVLRRAAHLELTWYKMRMVACLHIHAVLWVCGKLLHSAIKCAWGY